VERPPQIEPRHLEKLAVVYVRQSTPEQVRDNLGSTDVQRRLADRAREWGWPDSRIQIIDDDLGVSGSHAGLRQGFSRMLDLMHQGEVAIVFVNDSSRLSRNPSDAEAFLLKATAKEVLLEVNGQLFSPGDANLIELFGLRLQNLLAWWEQANRTRLFRAAKLAKAARGFAVTAPPDGIVTSVRGKWVKDPDPQIRESFQRVFDLYPQLGSARKVRKYLNAHGLPLPRRTRGQLLWETATDLRIIRILRNPAYTDAYVYSRTKLMHDSSGKHRRVVLPRSNWHMVRNHHEGYVTWEQWEQIQDALDRNRRANRPPIRGGAALLQGLLWCGSCDRRFKAVYDRRVQGKSLPAYLCGRLEGNNLVRCFRVPAERVDSVIVPAILDALVPPRPDDLLSLIRTQQDELASIRRTRDAHLRRAEAEVADARQRYLAVNPQHDLVKADLEARLQQAIGHLDQLRRDHATSSTTLPRSLRDTDCDELIDLSKQLHRLWDAPTTSNEERKRLMHVVLSRVVIRNVSPEWIDLDIVWVGGFREDRRVIRLEGIGTMIETLRKAGHTDTQIADSLRAGGVLGRDGGRVTRNVVSYRVTRLGLQHRGTWAKGLLRIRELVLQNLAPRQILLELTTNGPRHYRDRWTLRCVTDSIRHLRIGHPLHGVPPLPPGPRPLGETPNSTIELMVRRRQQGLSWRAIAEELNAAGLRPAQAAKFTDRLCAELVCNARARGQLPILTSPEATR
jgi:DNA invertase Pin-like site-specific DNA recombinase